MLPDVFQHPVAHLAIGEAVAHHVNERLRFYTCNLEPALIEALAKICLVIRMQFAGQVQPYLVDKSRQVHPAAHHFPRASRVNWISHVRTKKNSKIRAWPPPGAELEHADADTRAVDYRFLPPRALTAFQRALAIAESLARAAAVRPGLLLPPRGAEPCLRFRSAQRAFCERLILAICAGVIFFFGLVPWLVEVPEPRIASRSLRRASI